MKIKLTEKIKCLRCGNEWRPRKESESDEDYAEVKICPECKSPFFNVSKEKEKQ